MSYNAEQDLKYIEENIALLMYIVGLNPDNMGTTTIDELVNSARDLARVSSVRTTGTGLSAESLKLYRDEPSLSYLRSQRISLIANIRRFWYLRQLALGAINRG
jgi:hypothetical protein